MGGGPSSRVAEFQNTPKQDRDVEIEQHISISNKMIERLVEDATLANEVYLATAPRGDFKDKIYTEKLKCLDESHSEKSGLTVENLRTTVNRIELRQANMINPEPVCEEGRQQVIGCYMSSETPADIVQCWDTVGAFRQCVQQESTGRMRERHLRDSRDAARRVRRLRITKLDLPTP